MKRAVPLAVGGCAVAVTGLIAQRLYSWYTGNKYRSLPTIVLRNADNVTVHITPVGASIQRLCVPDSKGNLVDVVLGFEHADTYALLKQGIPYFGAVVGRCANRIAKGKFKVNEKEYQLAINNPPNALHGGPGGLHTRIFEARTEHTAEAQVAVLTYTSPDGEEGYPGTLIITVRYALMQHAPELRITFSATTDKATPVNLAQHTYFNLGGHSSGDVLSHTVTLAADHYTPVDYTLIPTGEVAPVAGTPFDFTTPRAIGEHIEQLPNGYDHNYVLFGIGKQAKFITKAGRICSLPRLAATVCHPSNGLQLQVLTTSPGMQFYTGGFLDGSLPDCKDGAVYNRYAGFCLETQNFPDAVNQESFPKVVLEQGEEYKHEVVYRFSNAGST